MPPRRHKRPRDYSPSPSPIPSIHSEREPSSAPSPQLPTPEALTNVDVVFQILRHVDRYTLAKCLTLSVTFHAAAGRLLYKHVNLHKTEAVLKILHQTNPVRQTRKHTQKVLTPLPFFAYTTYLTLSFHAFDALPRNWIEQLASLFPRVRSVRIKIPGGCVGCKKNPVCLCSLWALTSKLPVERISIDLWTYREAKVSSRRLRNTPFLPDGLSFPTATLAIVAGIDLDILAISRQLRDLDRPSGNFAWTSRFGSLQLIVSRLDGNINHYCDGLRVHPYVASGSVLQQDWEKHVASLGTIAGNLARTVSHTSTRWDIYNISNAFPQQATFWPSYLRAAAQNGTISIEHLMRQALDKSMSQSSRTIGDSPAGDYIAANRPEVVLRSREDYLSSLTHPDELTSYERDRVENFLARTTKDYGEVTGLFGNWVLGLPPKPAGEKDPASSGTHHE